MFVTGKKFNRLTVLQRVANEECGIARWLCVCECGNETLVRGAHLKSGSIKSCGCFKKDRMSIVNTKYKHGIAKTYAYRSWKGMLQRCYNSKNARYKDYGGRGIIVCERWKHLENFLEDMGERPKGLTIERIDNNKGYSPDNCKWATWKEQNRNRRSNHLVTYQGETKCLIEWAEALGIKYHILSNRLNRLGYSPEVAFNM